MPFNGYRKLDRNQMIEEMKKFEQTFGNFSQTEIDLMDPGIMSLVSLNLSSDEVLDLYRDGSDD